ncbi:hypothetical protein [Spiroplasma endosymbiont of Polydrusus pterygomalis]|uniref:hypothetical protein n=1 Tax=Spiroplasma endosymbiont of Polydrusus pterygomalis TaxID=3139327 RepID=UPI003CCB1956
MQSRTNIKTINGNSLLGNGDISINTDNDWEIVNTSDFISDTSDCYDIKNYDENNYSYQIFVQNNENNPDGGYGGVLTTHPKFPFSVKVPIETNDGLYFCLSFSQGKIISYKNQYGTPAKMQALYIQRKKII